MYITNIKHFLDERGKIAFAMPDEARQMASFMVSIVDAATDEFTEAKWKSDIQCNEPECAGIIQAETTNEGEKVQWHCSKCENEGVISDWQGTKWDNTKLSLTKKDRQLLEDFFSESLSDEDKDLFLQKGAKDREFLRMLVKMVAKTDEEL